MLSIKKIFGMNKEPQPQAWTRGKSIKLEKDTSKPETEKVNENLQDEHRRTIEHEDDLKDVL